MKKQFLMAVCVVLVLVGFFVVGYLVSPLMPTYYQITNNIQLKDISKDFIIAYTEFDDGLDCMTFNGRFRNKKALVMIELNYTEYLLSEIGDTEENNVVYVVEISANATYKIDNNNYAVAIEEVATILTEHY